MSLFALSKDNIVGSPGRDDLGNSGGGQGWGGGWGDDRRHLGPSGAQPWDHWGDWTRGSSGGTPSYLKPFWDAGDWSAF